MLQFARQENIDFFVCCDDDITQFGKAVGSKAIKGQNANDLIGPLELFQRSGAALAGVNQRQFAWSEKKAVKLNNGKAAGCVFLNTQKVTWAYRENTKEDLDFTMQCLDNRQNFLFFARTFYSTPAIGSNAGGLHEDYRHKRDAKWAIEIQKAWPNYAKIIEQYGRMDVRLDYKRKALDMGLQVR